jgi:hypothetical protein
MKADEFIRRFLIHVLPEGFHRIRHYGFPFVRPVSGQNSWTPKQLILRA